MGMIQKVKTLQKRLIAKTEEEVEKDLLIQEKEKLYHELKSILASQPGPEVAESVAQYQQSLKEKTKGMKSMAAELNMYHAQVNDYKDEIERLTRELQDMKRKYFDQKRREQLLKDAQRGEKTSSATQQNRRHGLGQRVSRLEILQRIGAFSPVAQRHASVSL